MVRDILDANRLKAGENIPLNFSICQLDQVIDAAITELNDISDHTFKINNECGEIRGYWDGDALQRVIENLAGNAVKYGFHDLPITVSIRKNFNGVEIAVHNYGNPISLEEQKSLFALYQRANSILNSGIKGWGIGLTLVKGITEAHRGKVRVESDDRGTTFYIQLPLDCRTIQCINE